MNDDDNALSPDVQTLPLTGGHELVLQRGPDADVIRFLRPDGMTGISISITASGIHVGINGSDLTLQTSGAITLDAERIALKGRSEVTIESGGEARVAAAGAMTLEGRSQLLRSTRGNVNIKANDDVQVDGERIRLNS
jgi:hypothetical protein